MPQSSNDAGRGMFHGMVHDMFVYQSGIRRVQGTKNEALFHGIGPARPTTDLRELSTKFSAFGFHLLEFCESESERASLSGKTVKVKVKGLSQANVSIWVLYSLGVC